MLIVDAKCVPTTVAVGTTASANVPSGSVDQPSTSAIEASLRGAPVP